MTDTHRTSEINRVGLYRKSQADKPWEDLDTWKKLEREIRLNSPKTPYSRQWKPIARNLALILGHRSFRFCFLKASLVSLTRDTAVVQFENLFKMAYIRDYYLAELTRAIRGVHPGIAVIGLKVAPVPLPVLEQGEIFYTRKNTASLSGGTTASQTDGGLA